MVSEAGSLHNLSSSHDSLKHMTQHRGLPVRFLAGIIFRRVPPAGRIQTGVCCATSERRGAPDQHREGAHLLGSRVLASCQY